MSALFSGSNPSMTRLHCYSYCPRENHSEMSMLLKRCRLDRKPLAGPGIIEDVQISKRLTEDVESVNLFLFPG